MLQCTVISVVHGIHYKTNELHTLGRSEVFVGTPACGVTPVTVGCLWTSAVWSPPPPGTRETLQRGEVVTGGPARPLALIMTGPYCPFITAKR